MSDDATTRGLLDAIRAQPGITIPELADAAGIAISAVYKQLPALERGAMKNATGRGWFAVPLPGCCCPASYVRDVIRGHTEEACAFYGLFGPELRDAHHAAMDQLAGTTTVAPHREPRAGTQLSLFG